MEKIEELDKIVEDHLNSLDEINDFIWGTTLSYTVFEREYSGLLERFSEEGNKSIKKLKNNIPEYTKEIRSQAIISSIARTEAFLNDIIEFLFKWNKNSLISNKTLTYKEIIGSENIDDLIKSIMDKEVLLLSHASFNDKLNFLKNKFKLEFPTIEDYLKDIIELFTTRNIILHNNGVVNQTYLIYNKDSSSQLGEKKELDKKYIHNAIIYLSIVGREIGDKVKEKLKEKEASS